MTGPFVRVQEIKLHGATWVNVAQIVKIQEASNWTTVFLEGAGTMQIEEPAEVLVGRLGEALVRQMLASQTPATSPDGARRGMVKPAEEQYG